MNSSFETVRDLYDLNTGLLTKALEDMKESDLFFRPLDKGNSQHWIAGHIVTSRFTTANILDIDDTCPWGKMFEGGAEVRDKSVYPSIDEIKTAWQTLSRKLMERFDIVTDEDLAGDPPFQVPGMECTKAAAISFLIFHEAYHIGQLGYVRRLLGHDRLVG